MLRTLCKQSVHSYTLIINQYIVLRMLSDLIAVVLCYPTAQIQVTHNRRLIVLVFYPQTLWYLFVPIHVNSSNFSKGLFLN